MVEQNSGSMVQVIEPPLRRTVQVLSTLCPYWSVSSTVGNCVVVGNRFVHAHLLGWRRIIHCVNTGKSLCRLWPGGPWTVPIRSVHRQVPIQRQLSVVTSGPRRLGDTAPTQTDPQRGQHSHCQRRGRRLAQHGHSSGTRRTFRH